MIFKISLHIIPLQLDQICNLKFEDGCHANFYWRFFLINRLEQNKHETQAIMKYPEYSKESMVNYQTSKY